MVGVSVSASPHSGEMSQKIHKKETSAKEGRPNCLIIGHVRGLPNILIPPPPPSILCYEIIFSVFTPIPPIFPLYAIHRPLPGSNTSLASAPCCITLHKLPGLSSHRLVFINQRILSFNPRDFRPGPWPNGYPIPARYLLDSVLIITRYFGYPKHRNKQDTRQKIL